jgi:hypothetical protein
VEPSSLKITAVGKTFVKFPSMNKHSSNAHETKNVLLSFVLNVSIGAPFSIEKMTDETSPAVAGIENSKTRILQLNTFIK